MDNDEEYERKHKLVTILRFIFDIGVNEATAIVSYWWDRNMLCSSYHDVSGREVASLCLLASKVVKGEWVWDGEDIVKHAPLQRKDYAVTL